jgi:hypothetical protein
VHGLAASVLVDSASAQVPAMQLAGFNLGVEAGSPLVACLLRSSTPSARAWYHRFALPALSSAIAALLARLLERSVGIAF